MCANIMGLKLYYQHQRFIRKLKLGLKASISVIRKVERAHVIEEMQCSNVEFIHLSVKRMIVRLPLIFAKLHPRQKKLKSMHGK